MHLSQVIKQKPYEHIVYRLRRHAITFLPMTLLFLFLGIIPIALYYLILQISPALLEQELWYTIGILLASVFYLSIYLFFYVQFLDFYLDVWVVTNDRIIDMEQFGLFTRTTTELDLFRIQDITAEIRGLFPTVFNYGNLYIKTASANTDIVFRNIPNPNGIREHVIRLADEDRKFHFKQHPNE